MQKGLGFFYNGSQFLDSFKEGEINILNKMVLCPTPPLPIDFSYRLRRPSIISVRPKVRPLGIR